MREDCVGVDIAGVSRRDAISQVNHFTAITATIGTTQTHMRDDAWRL